MKLNQFGALLHLFPLPALLFDSARDRVENLTQEARDLFHKTGSGEVPIPPWLREAIEGLVEEVPEGTTGKTVARGDSRMYQVSLRRLPSPHRHILFIVLQELPGGVMETKDFQTMLDAIPTPIFFKDLEGTYLGCNTALCRVLGREKEEIVGRNVFDIVPHSRACGCAEEDLAAARTGRPRSYERSLTYPDGSRHEVVFNKAPFFTPDGGVGGVVGIVHDITERKRAEERIQQLAFHDILTSLPNRALLRDRIGQMIRQCERSGSRFAILFLDLDGFKTINDTFGQRTGDQLLRAVAGRLNGVVRKSDTLARVGGDEFVALLPEVQDEESAARVARKILFDLAVPFLLGPHEIFTSASIGIALFPADGRDLDVLLRNADAAMYQAKETGRKGFQFFSEATAGCQGRVSCG